ncbi:chitinase, partial [Streptomyces sp. SID6041]|nr:chitinase [Streptomyces sp. SID6041]
MTHHGRHLPRVLGAAGALCLGSALLTLVPAQASAATELLGNPGFEAADLAPWTCTGTAAPTATTPRSGSSALSATPGAGDLGACTQTVTVQPSTAYTLTAWVKGSYVTLGATGTGVSTSTWANAPAWTQLTRAFTTGPGTTQVTVTLSGWYGSPYQADDVSLSTVGATPSPSQPSSHSPSPTPSPSATTTPTPSPTPTPTATATPGNTVRVTNAKELQ